MAPHPGAVDRTKQTTMTVIKEMRSFGMPLLEPHPAPFGKPGL